MGVLRSVALLVVSALLSVCLAEGALRLLAPQPASWLDIYRSHPTLPFPTLLPDIDREIDTGELHWRILTDADGILQLTSGSKKHGSLSRTPGSSEALRWICGRRMRPIDVQPGGRLRRQ